MRELAILRRHVFGKNLFRAFGQFEFVGVSEPTASAFLGEFAFFLLLAILLNLALYRFFASKRGWPFAIRTVPIHQLYFLYSGLAMVTGVALFALKTEPRLTTKPAVKTEPLAIPPEIGV